LREDDVLVVYETANFYVRLPTRKSLLPEELWIVPREHLPSFNLARDSLQKELQNCMEILTQHYNPKGWDVLFVEIVTTYERQGHTVSRGSLVAL
jgi:hypothetical protein